jgi:hypothetical protein
VLFAATLQKVSFFFANYLEIPKIFSNFVAEFCGNATIVRLYRGFIVVCSKANYDYPLFFSVGLLINSKQFKTTK